MSNSHLENREGVEELKDQLRRAIVLKPERHASREKPSQVVGLIAMTGG